MNDVAILKRLAMYIGIFIGSATPAWAATSGMEDDSDLFVWIFLAFCALIIIAQLIPAALMVVGVVKSAKSKSAEPAPVKDAR